MSTTLLAARDVLSFYSSAAGIIPVIILALAFQFGSSGFEFFPERVLSDEPDPERRAERDVRIAIYSLVMLAVLLVGEAVSLFVVAVGSPQPWWAAIVAVSLVVGGGGLVIPIVLAHTNVIVGARRADRPRGDGPAMAVRVLIGVAVAASSVGAVYAVVTPSRIKTPSVLGQTVFAAEQTLQRAELRLSPAVRQQAVVNAKPGTIIGQSPASGTSVKREAEVTVSVAVGSARTAVPKLVGRTLARAGAVLRAADLTVGSVSPKGAPPTARVTSQIPAAGEVVRRGLPVALFVRR